MEDKFIETINYIEELKLNLANKELNNDEKMLAIIKHALLSDRDYQGSIIITKNNENYKVSNIQKHSYAWFLVDKVIDIDYVMYMLNELGIASELEHYIVSDHMNDYELSFSLPRLKKRIKIK